MTGYRMIEQVDQAAPKAAPAPVNEGYLGSPTQGTVGYIDPQTPDEAGGMHFVFLYGGYLLCAIGIVYLGWKILGWIGKQSDIGVIKDMGTSQGQGSFIMTPIIAALWFLAGMFLVWVSGFMV
ncbi:MAG: hypothetical protein VR70_11060 [Rhodospirillaceae bacterium BRH_c57]|nr:MAG: hypothetical protein VR70_11060 [Rhodospirillaceae bacterium BRH_c57]